MTRPRSSLLLWLGQVFFDAFQNASNGPVRPTSAVGDRDAELLGQPDHAPQLSARFKGHAMIGAGAHDTKECGLAPAREVADGSSCRRHDDAMTMPGGSGIWQARCCYARCC